MLQRAVRSAAVGDAASALVRHLPRRMRSDGLETVNVRTSRGTTVPVTTPYYREKHARRAKRRPGLYPALVVLGIYDRCTPKLASDASRAVAMHSSLAKARRPTSRCAAWSRPGSEICSSSCTSWRDVLLAPATKEIIFGCSACQFADGIDVRTEAFRTRRAGRTPERTGVLSCSEWRIVVKNSGMRPSECVFLGLVLVLGSTLAEARWARAQGFENTTIYSLLVGDVEGVGETRQLTLCFNLTLGDAVARALERNRDIAVQRILPLVRDMQVATADAAFLPLASSGFGLGKSALPSRSLLDGGGVGGGSVIADQASYDVAVEQRLRWGGGKYSLTWNSSRFESTNVYTSFNPSLGANMVLEVTQPLLRGFRTDPQRTELVVSRITQDISELDLEETIINTLAEVRVAYWELVYARDAVRVQQQALESAEQLVRDNRARVEIGVIGEIEVVQARAEAAVRRQLLTEAIRVRRTSELALKQLIVNGTSDELWDAEINPTDQPHITSVGIDLEEAIRVALDRRTDISRVRRQLDIGNATVDNLRNSALPALDIVGSYQLTGQGGPRLVASGSSLDALFAGTGDVISGGYADALRNIVGADYPMWNVQVRMTYPLGRSAEKAAYERAQLEHRQTQAEIQLLELRVVAEVTNAAMQIEAIREVIDATIVSRELAEEQLRAERIKFEVGLSTNYLVIQMQRDLTAAQSAELRAILDYQRALLEFERVQRASLATMSITIGRGM